MDIQVGRGQSSLAEVMGSTLEYPNYDERVAYPLNDTTNWGLIDVMLDFRRRQLYNKIAMPGFGDGLSTDGRTSSSFGSWV